MGSHKGTTEIERVRREAREKYQEEQKQKPYVHDALPASNAANLSASARRNTVEGKCPRCNFVGVFKKPDPGDLGLCMNCSQKFLLPEMR